jgi:hypothetical protein
MNCHKSLMARMRKKKLSQGEVQNAPASHDGTSVPRSVVRSEDGEQGKDGLGIELE